jgi:dipeptidyl-peptidase-4
MMTIKGLLTISMLSVAFSVTAQQTSSYKELAGWHKDYTPDLQGTNVKGALDLLRSRGMKPSGKVVVGIIDSGADTANVNLQEAFWTNPGERVNGLDDDGNGYKDDIHGWNFLGTADGKFDMTSAGTEEFRQFKALYPKYKNTTSRDAATDKKEYDFYLRMRKAAKIDQYLTFYEMSNRLREQLDSLSLRRLKAMEKNIYGIEHDQDKRLLIGDRLDDADDRFYGNNHLTIDGCDHGTFVAGIVGGTAEEDHHYDGIASGIAQLMIVRASPDGDEYDKDVATSIRYAVDNGARVVNISLGKYCSPQARMVNDAIRYAADHDVLVVCAAGNDSRNLDTIPIYPAGTDHIGEFFPNFIRVGASDEKGHRADISNYGVKTVHLFAPGTLIASVFPGNRYDLSQGTSLAAPVVSAVAALLRSYFPYLSAAQIRQLLMETVRPMTDAETSIAGGTIDMLAAVRRLLDAPIDWYRAESVSEEQVSHRVYALSPSPMWEGHTPYVSFWKADAKRPDAARLLPGTRKKYMMDARTGKTMLYDKDVIDMYKCQHPEKKDKNSNLGRGRIRDSQTLDSAFTMLGDRYNLHVRDNRTGEVRQLTTDGKDFCSYCSRGASDKLSDRQAQGYWKGHVFFDMIYDDSAVKDLNIVHSMENPPRLEQKKMPLPNTPNIRRFKLYWYNADTGEGRLLPLAPNDDYFISLDYDKKGDGQYYLRRSRSVDTLELCRINPATGEIKVIISEVCKPHVNVNLFKYQLIDHGRQVLWWSDRTGRGNYYLYDGVNGRLLNRVTQGDRMVAGRIEKLDEKNRELIFLGYGQEGDDPHYTYYYKVGLNGKGQQLLTHGQGTHNLQFSSDERYAIDSYSRMDMPTVYQLVDVKNPRKYCEFARVSEQEARQAGWVKPVLVKVKAADEQTDLYGVMYLPKELREQVEEGHPLSSKKFPVISNVYPGPQDDQVPRSFTVDENGNQSLAELGFVVINVQPRGSSPLRDKNFYCYGYGRLRDYPVADDKHTIETLAQKYPFIDLSRVGIYGHSGGGFETATAMMTYPDFYKVGVAASGNYDNHAYIQWWAETYHGYGKEIPTTMELAGNLKGRLLLMTGEVDENVPVASTVRLADALQKAGKRFDMMVFPEQGHGLMGDYYTNIIRYYFLEHLVKPEPFDVNIVNHK